MLKNVQTLVEQSYVDGKPKHHLDTARDVNYTPGSSIFFITDHASFMKLSDDEIHRIAKHRHIVVQDIPQEGFDWSRKTLAKLGDLEQLREIQGTICDSYTLLHMLIIPRAAGQCRSDDKTPGMLKVGTLEDLHAACDERVLLALSLPLGASDVVDTPRIRYVLIFSRGNTTLMLHFKRYIF